MWPYSSDEQVWLVPAKDWAAGLPQQPSPAFTDEANGAWPYATVDNNGPFDPQIFICK